MERHQLEDRIRASLQARAEDVAPTPQLWERVSERTARRARWTLGLWALSGVAAVAVVVFGGMALLGTPRQIEIQPEPDVVAPTDSQPVPVDPSVPTVVTTDGETLFEVDATTGEVRLEMAPYEGFKEGGAAVEVAVRPFVDPGQMTVATVVQVEGSFDIEISVFDADGQRIDRQRLGMAVPATDLPPDVVWSADGRYLMWAGTSFVDGEAAGPSLWAYDWGERPVNDDGEAEPFPVTAAGADGALFTDDGTVDLRTWTGTPLGTSTVLATTTTGGAFRIDLAGSRSDCEGNEPCPPTFEADVVDLGFEGMAPMDLGTLANGVDLALVVPTAGQGGPDGDAESATLQLVAGPMSDGQRVLDMPQLTEGTAAPLDAWMAVAGNRVAVGMGPEVHLLTVSGDTLEELEVTDAVRLPQGTRMADLGTLATPGEAPDADVPAPSSTTTLGPAEEVAPAIGDDGVPVHVLTGGPDELQLVDRRTPGEPLVTMGRPDGIDAEMAPGEVVVHPDSTADDLQLVTTWSVGESQVLARTVVRWGQVVANEVLDEQAQPTNTGGAAETAHSVPVFSPDGRWLAWVESPDGGAGPNQVRIVDWDDGEAGGPGRTVTAPADGPRPFQLLDWARTSEGDVLTMAPTVGPGPDAQEAATMIELRLQVTASLIAETTEDDWRFVDLPGALFDAGSYTFEDGAQRYVVFDGGDEVVYALAESPDTAVGTGARPFSEGRVVAFGPDSALVQRADGGWQRVQVDTGAASPVQVPEGTRVLLPWRG